MTGHRVDLVCGKCGKEGEVHHNERSCDGPRAFERWENYDSHGLLSRSCTRMRQPHRPHDFMHRDGEAHCWGRNRVPPDAVEKYTTPGCTCDFCTDLPKGIWPRTIMCSKQWDALPQETKNQIHESVSD